MKNLDQLVAQLAEAQSALEQAEADRHHAAAHVDQIQQRIGELETRRSELTARRLNGNGGKADNDELLLIAGDLELLRASLKDAEAEVSVNSTTTERAIVERFQFELDHATAGNKLDILKGKATEADALLVRLMQEVEAAGGGLNLSQLWHPSRQLHVTICREFPPA